MQTKIRLFLYLITYIFLLLVLTNSNAGGNVKDLLPVKLDNKWPCFTYYYYNNQLYCSTEVRGLKSNLDSGIKNYQLKSDFLDERLWQIVLSKAAMGNIIISYDIPHNANSHWHESVTNQFIVEAPQRTTLKEFVDSFRASMSSNGFQPVYSIIENQADYTIFEMKVLNAGKFNQDNLFILRKVKGGFHGLSYTIDKPDMGDANRKKWIKILKNAHHWG